MQEAYVDSGNQQSVYMRNSTLLYQQELTHYLVHTSTILRSQTTNINALLKHLVIFTENIPGFYHCALYLREHPCFYQVQISPADQDQIAYFRQYPLPEASVNSLMSDQYREGQVYIIPLNNTEDQPETVQQLLASFEPAYNIIPNTPFAVPPCALADSIIAMPLYSHTNALLGFLLCMPSLQRAEIIQESLPLLGLFTNQVAALLEKACLHEEVQNALEQVKESEQLINHFLVTASHELRTPLTSTQGYLELLSAFGSTLTEDTQQYFLNNARRSCEELILVVSTIMDASRLNQDKLELRPCQVNLLDIIQTIMQILHPVLDKQERKVDIAIAKQCNVWVDSLRLRQILLNLLNNALQYTPISTEIAVSAQEWYAKEMCQHFTVGQHAISLLSEQTYIVIAVRDWGPGIALEYQPRLFTKFMRLSQALNSMQRGAGLGLYLCRQWVEAMHGYIWVESTGIPGEGCTFYVALPSTQTS